MTKKISECLEYYKWERDPRYLYHPQPYQWKTVYFVTNIRLRNMTKKLRPQNVTIEAVRDEQVDKG